MKILEVRDGFIKFEAMKNFAISSFVQIDDKRKSFIAQVIKVNKMGDFSVVFAKILFLYNGAFNEYDNSLPSLNSEIKEFDFNIYSETFKTKSSVIAGFLVDKNVPIYIDKDFLDKKTLIVIDSNDKNEIIVSNLAKQLEKSLIIDTLGTINASKYIAGVDFKLPLNVDALQFLFEDCLNDATSDSKSLIKEIFQELAEYAKTVSFLPFATLKTIIDDMVDKSHIFKLLVLKNKLAKFDKLGYFAATTDEAENLDRILELNNAVIDVSKLDPVFQNRYISIILSALATKNNNTNLFMVASNNLNKRNLKNLLIGNLATVFVTHSRFKYLNEIKSMFTNYLIEPSLTNKQIFKKYVKLLEVMSNSSYLLVGEGTNNIPFVSSVIELEDYVSTQVAIDDSNKEQEPDSNIEVENEDLNEQENSNELTSTQVLELEKALEIDSDEMTIDNIEVSEEVSSIEAIEKNSESLIERVTEEVQEEVVSENMQIFNNDFEDVEDFSELEEERQDEVFTEVVSEEKETLEEDLEVTSIEEEALSNGVESIEEETFVDNIDEVEEVLDVVNDEVVIDSQETFSEEFHTQVDEIQTIEIPEDISEFAESEELLEEIEDDNTVEAQQDTVSDEIVEVSEPVEEFSEAVAIEQEIDTKNEELLEEVEEEPVNAMLTSDEIKDDEFDVIVELDEAEIGDADIIVDLEEELQEPLDEEALDKAIVEDVDKVFTTMKDETISDSDLDFIDELNNIDEEEVVALPEGMEELPELQEVDDGFLEPLEEVNDFIQDEEPEQKEILERREASTPIVPVYGADIPVEDTVMSDDIEQGDTVVHAKYGNGIVEKMIKYGTKTLYSINFDNVGRRLLDPTLTEIKKS